MNKIKNLFILAKASSPSKDSYNHYNKILEKDITNSKAWFGRGVSIGWISTTNNNNLKEMLDSFRKAIECATDKEKYIKRASKEIDGLVLAHIAMLLDAYCVSCDNLRLYNTDPLIYLSNEMDKIDDEFYNKIDNIINLLLMYNVDMENEYALEVETIKLLIDICEDSIEASESITTCEMFENHLTELMKITGHVEHKVLEKKKMGVKNRENRRKAALKKKKEVVSELFIQLGKR